MPKVVKVTAAQKMAAQMVIERAQEKGVPVSDDPAEVIADHKVANAERRPKQNTAPMKAGDTVTDKTGNDFPSHPIVFPTAGTLHYPEGTILAKDMKVGDKILGYGTVKEIRLVRLAIFDSNSKVQISDGYENVLHTKG